LEFGEDGDRSLKILKLNIQEFIFIFRINSRPQK